MTLGLTACSNAARTMRGCVSLRAMTMMMSIKTPMPGTGRRAP